MTFPQILLPSLSISWVPSLPLGTSKCGSAVGEGPQRSQGITDAGFSMNQHEELGRRVAVRTSTGTGDMAMSKTSLMITSLSKYHSCRV